jgi:hypothetical protein
MCSSSSEMVWLFELTRPLAGGLVIVGVIGQTCYYLDHGVTVPGNEQLSVDNIMPENKMPFSKSTCQS